MSIFCIKIIGNKYSKEFFNETIDRLKEENIVKNPFRGKIFSITKPPLDYYILDLTPVYPKIHAIGIYLLVIAFIFGGFSLWLLPGAIIYSFGFFSSSLFYYLMVILGLRKKGFKGKVKLVGKTRIIRVLTD